MKLVLWMPVLLLCIASCKKSYTCSCTTTTTFVVTGFGTFPIPSKTDDAAYSKRMTKKQAQSACGHQALTIQSLEENYAAAAASAYGKPTINTNCKLN